MFIYLEKYLDGKFRVYIFGTKVASKDSWRYFLSSANIRKGAQLKILYVKSKFLEKCPTWATLLVHSL